jgi:membrane protease YdiL (CAAX protease family)
MFIVPARKQPQLWRFAVGLVMGVLSYLALSLFYFQTVISVLSGGNPAFLNTLDAGSTPLSLLILLFSFVTMIMSVAVSARLMHGRSLFSVLGPRPLFWRDFRIVLGILLLLAGAIAILPPWHMGDPYVPNLDFSLWMTLLPLSLIAVFIQVSAEEIVFRGYLQQQLAARFKSPLVWMLLPSVLFALGHYVPAEAGSNAMLIAVWAGIFGVLMADLTARAGSLGPAIAVHLCNNVFAILVVSLPDSLSGLSLYHTPFAMTDEETLRQWLPVDFLTMFVFWLAARLALRR